MTLAVAGEHNGSVTERRSLCARPLLTLATVISILASAYAQTNIGPFPLLTAPPPPKTNRYYIEYFWASLPSCMRSNELNWGTQSLEYIFHQTNEVVPGTNVARFSNLV